MPSHHLVIGDRECDLRGIGDPLRVRRCALHLHRLVGLIDGIVYGGDGDHPRTGRLVCRNRERRIGTQRVIVRGRGQIRYGGNRDRRLLGGGMTERRGYGGTPAIFGDGVVRQRQRDRRGPLVIGDRECDLRGIGDPLRVRRCALHLHRLVGLIDGIVYGGDGDHPRTGRLVCRNRERRIGTQRVIVRGRGQIRYGGNRDRRLLGGGMTERRGYGGTPAIFGDGVVRQRQRDRRGVVVIRDREFDTLWIGDPLRVRRCALHLHRLVGLIDGIVYGGDGDHPRTGRLVCRNRERRIGTQRVIVRGRGQIRYGGNRDRRLLGGGMTERRGYGGTPAIFRRWGCPTASA